jgi:hypothetical protein
MITLQERRHDHIVSKHEAYIREACGVDIQQKITIDLP